MSDRHVLVLWKTFSFNNSNVQGTMKPSRHVAKSATLQGLSKSRSPSDGLDHEVRLEGCFGYNP